MNPTARLKYEFKDDFEWIRVIDVFPDSHRQLFFESSVQGTLNLKDHTQPVLEYIGVMAHGAKTILPRPFKLVAGGLGCAALLHVAHRWWHDARIITVESNSRVYEIAKRFFRVERHHKVVIGDFRAVLDGRGYDRTDIFFVDCYLAHSIPRRITTCEFMVLLMERLAPGGIAAFNLWNASCNRFCGDQLRTILEVFGSVAVIACREDRNLVAFAAKEPAASWPKHISVKGHDYPLRLLFLDQPDAWPDYMIDSRILTDENVHAVFSEIGIEF